MARLCACASYITVLGKVWWALNCIKRFKRKREKIERNEGVIGDIMWLKKKKSVNRVHDI